MIRTAIQARTLVARSRDGDTFERTAHHGTPGTPGDGAEGMKPASETTSPAESAPTVEAVLQKLAAHPRNHGPIRRAGKPGVSAGMLLLQTLLAWPLWIVLVRRGELISLGVPLTLAGYFFQWIWINCQPTPAAPPVLPPTAPPKLPGGPVHHASAPAARRGRPVNTVRPTSATAWITPGPV